MINVQSGKPSNDAIKAATADQVFDEYGKYYDLLYRDKDYAGEASYVVAALRNADPKVRTVLEFGSGVAGKGSPMMPLGPKSRALQAQAGRPSGDNSLDGNSGG